MWEWSGVWDGLGNMFWALYRFSRFRYFAIFAGIKESDTGLAAPSQWDLVSDKQMMQEEQPLQVCRSPFILYLTGTSSCSQ